MLLMHFKKGTLSVAPPGHDEFLLNLLLMLAKLSTEDINLYITMKKMSNVYTVKWKKDRKEKHVGECLMETNLYIVR